MTYSPIIPATGYAGWKLLNRTMDKQKATFVASAEIQRDEEYFRAKIGSVTTAEELVSDRRLMKVALGAFGLDADIDNKYFIRKVLEEGTLASDSLANKLADKTYLKFSAAFGFGDFSVPRTALSDFADEILGKYETRQFEIAVGDSDESLRLALSVQRELPDLAEDTASNNARWYSIIASNSLSTVLQSALGLPTSVESLDVDQQLEIYKQKAEGVFGTSDVSKLAESDNMERLVRLYLVRTQMDGTTSATGSSIALQLLQGEATSSTNSTLSLLL